MGGVGGGGQGWGLVCVRARKMRNYNGKPRKTKQLQIQAEATTKTPPMHLLIKFNGICSFPRLDTYFSSLHMIDGPQCSCIHYDRSIDGTNSRRCKPIPTFCYISFVCFEIVESDIDRS